MSYSHYAVQSRAFSPVEWASLRRDATAIIDEARRLKVKIDSTIGPRSIHYVGPTARLSRTDFRLWRDPSEYLDELRVEASEAGGPDNLTSYIDRTLDSYNFDGEGLTFGFHTRWRQDNGVAQAILVRAKHHAPEALVLSSDAPLADWDYEEGCNANLHGPSGLSFVRTLWPDDAESDLALLRADLERDDDE